MNEFLFWLASVKNSPVVWPQAIHFLIGYAILLTSYRDGLRRRFWMIGAGVLVFTLAIEIFYDPKYEGDPFFWGGAKDMAFYVLGVIAGLVADYL